MDLVSSLALGFSASMIRAVAGPRVKVMGRSMAMVAVGPMPGSTPTSVPSSTPMKQ